MSLPAITLHRPWAWAATLGPKRCENRGWKPPRDLMGKHFGIHAGKKWDPDSAASIEEHIGIRVPLESEHVAGAIVGVVRLVALISGRDGEFELLAGTMPADFDSRWFVGDFGWVFDDVVPIEPVPCRGAQGLWQVPPPVLEIVRARWKEAKS